MKKVLVETPFMYKSDNPEERIIGQLRNITYVRHALHDCILRGETPYASHLILTQPGVLDDDNPDERKLGIDAGLEWGKAAEISAFYLDLGTSTGMIYGMQNAEKALRPIERRNLEGWENAFTEEPEETLIRLNLFTPEQLNMLKSNHEILGAFGPLEVKQPQPTLKMS